MLHEWVHATLHACGEEQLKMSPEQTTMVTMQALDTLDTRDIPGISSDGGSRSALSVPAMQSQLS